MIQLPICLLLLLSPRFYRNWSQDDSTTNVLGNISIPECPSWGTQHVVGASPDAYPLRKLGDMEKPWDCTREWEVPGHYLACPAPALSDYIHTREPEQEPTSWALPGIIRDNQAIIIALASGFGIIVQHQSNSQAHVFSGHISLVPFLCCDWQQITVLLTLFFHLNQNDFPTSEFSAFMKWSTYSPLIQCVLVIIHIFFPITLEFPKKTPNQ